MDKIEKGCVVMMRRETGMPGYGNHQCVADVCEPLGTISLYDHNQHYGIHDIKEILEYPPDIEQARQEQREKDARIVEQYIDECMATDYENSCFERIAKQIRDE